MFERLKGVLRRDRDDADRAEARADRAARRAERKGGERSAADLDAEARHYANIHHGNVGGGNVGGPGGS
jgi:hypothetical protein